LGPLENAQITAWGGEKKKSFVVLIKRERMNTTDTTGNGGVTN